jgi:hypothetical protein
LGGIMNRRKSHELEVEPGKVLKHFTKSEALAWAER